MSKHQTITDNQLLLKIHNHLPEIHQRGSNKDYDNSKQLLDQLISAYPKKGAC